MGRLTLHCPPHSRVFIFSHLSSASDPVSKSFTCFFTHLSAFLPLCPLLNVANTDITLANYGIMVITCGKQGWFLGSLSARLTSLLLISQTPWHIGMKTWHICSIYVLTTSGRFAVWPRISVRVCPRFGCKCVYSYIQYRWYCETSLGVGHEEQVEEEENEEELLKCLQPAILTGMLVAE